MPKQTHYGESKTFFHEENERLAEIASLAESSLIMFGKPQEYPKIFHRRSLARSLLSAQIFIY